MSLRRKKSMEVPCSPTPDLFDLEGGWVVCRMRLLGGTSQPSHSHVGLRQKS